MGTANSFRRRLKLLPPVLYNKLCDDSSVSVVLDWDVFSLYNSVERTTSVSRVAKRRREKGEKNRTVAFLKSVRTPSLAFSTLA